MDSYLLSPGRVPGVSSLTGHLVHSYLLKQRYRIIGVVGQGGFGAVYKAMDTQRNNRLVAVKEMSKSGLTPQEVVEATETFEREALILAGLSHPNLPALYDHFSDAGRWYLVMDFIEGETLEEHLLEAIEAKEHGGLLTTAPSPSPGQGQGSGCLPVELVLEIGIQLCTVLDYLHTRQPPIIYRDLKPANVILTPSSGLCLIDFGVARHFKPGKAKDTIPFGSPGYAAPEQYGRAQTTPQSDIYSLGAMLHQILTGLDPSQTPFRFAPLQTSGRAGAVDRLLAGLEALIMQMVEIDQSKRPASAAVVKQELQRIAAVGSRFIADPGLPRPSPIYRPAPAPFVPTTPVAHAPAQRPSTVTPSPKQGFILTTYRHHTGAVRGVVWSPDGKYIASASEDQTVQVWNGKTGRKVYIHRDYAGIVYAVAWSPDGRRIASANHNHTVEVWPIVLGEGIRAFANRWLKTLGLVTSTQRGHTGEVHVVIWSPDGQYLASAGSDHTVQVWDAASGDSFSTYGGHSDTVYALAWSPNGKRIASGGNDHTLRVCDVTSGRKVFTKRNHSNIVLGVAWSPDGRYIASGGSDHKVRIWDAASGGNVLTYRGHSDTVHAVAWSPDGKHIASGSSDQTVQVWQALTGRDVFTHRGHIDRVNAVAWSPDGQCVASGSSDGTVQVWQAV
ncbi:MAG TPA: serine/threonine-protein kinase [Ktedonobacteraceae bacterium]|nr:serine/threonine-protein kinase [Ktedonobacteraceae bacterium]